MKSPVVATILSALSLAGVAVLWFEVDDLKDRMLTRASQAERQVADLGPAPSSQTKADTHGPAFPPADRRSPGGSVDSFGGPVSKDAPVRDREGQAARAAADEGPRQADPGAVPVRMLNNRFVGSVDELARRLHLTVPQKDRVAQAIERGRLRIEEILKIPDETGRSPYERRQEQGRKIREAIEQHKSNPEGATAGVLTLATDFFNHRNRQIPGRNATYGQEIDRIERETRTEIASTLNAQQKETFDQTSIDPMLGGGGKAVSFIMGGGPGIGESQIMIETGLDVVTEEPATESGATPPDHTVPVEGDR